MYGSGYFGPDGKFYGRFVETWDEAKLEIHRLRSQGFKPYLSVPVPERKKPLWLPVVASLDEEAPDHSDPAAAPPRPNKLPEPPNPASESTSPVSPAVSSKETLDIRGIGERLDALAKERQEREAREGKEEHAERGRNELDRAGWNSHGDVGVWSVGYHWNGIFKVLGGGYKRSTLAVELLPMLLAQGITPYITREQLGRWVPVWPGAV